jgi:hypothetical protein
MSYLIIMRVPGDTSKFREFFEHHSEEMNQISARAKVAGCSHHVFAIGDGVVTSVDQWDTRENFERFFSDPAIAEVMAGAGASGPPDVEVIEIAEFADSF